MNKRKVGENYEHLAADYLLSKGVRIVERNYRNRQGEIDLIGYDSGYLVFFEVKYRKNMRKGAPVEAVTYTKQKNICRVADYYRMLHGIGEFHAIRYDVIAICGEAISWYRNAFAHIY